MQVSTSECSVSLLGIPRSHRRDLHQMAPDQTKWYITLNGQESVRERFGVGFFGVTEVLWSDHSFKQAELRAVSKVSLWPEQYGVSKIDLYIWTISVQQEDSKLLLVSWWGRVEDGPMVSVQNNFLSGPKTSIKCSKDRITINCSDKELFHVLKVCVLCFCECVISRTV